MNGPAKRLAAQEVAEIYHDRSRQFAGQAAMHARHAGRTQKAYLLVLTVAGGCLMVATSGVPNAGLWFVAGLILLAAWVAGVFLDRHFRYAWRVSRLFHRCNQQSLARMERQWEKVPVPAVEIPDHHGALAEDLDFSGYASLLHLVCRAQTAIGVATLRDWLLEPAGPGEIRQRQEAVAELSSELPLRQELEVRAALLGRDPQSFLDWAEGPSWFAGRTWTRWLLFVPSAGPGAAILVTATGIVPTSVGVGAAVLACLVNLVITTAIGARMHAVFRKTASRLGITAEYLRLFRLVAQTPGNSAMLARLRRTAANREVGAVCGLQKLTRIMVFAYASRDPFKAAVYLPLQFLMLWDFHLLLVLERWQRRWGPHCRRWFESLGELEAISSFAALRQENPDWCLADVDPQHSRGFSAREMGHPLLPAVACVRNDVALGPPGKFLFVSGSNMSGKSTLLRAIGVNAVLAQAGAPVCAREWTMSPARLATAIRIDDSLADGISLFLAGLYRVKNVVAQAREVSSLSGTTLLYLLDEPLQGTNAAERRIATRKVVELLLMYGAVGVVSGHDVELAKAESLADACIAAHFQETIDKTRHPITIHFDYRLRPGIATTTNALELMELVGIQ